MGSPLASPQLPWRNRFLRAMEQQQPDVLEDLLQDPSRDLREDWQVKSGQPASTPLGLAIGRFDAWGVAWLLERGEVLKELHLDQVFKEIETSRQASDRVGETLVERLWPVLLSRVRASEELCKNVAGHYFRGLRYGRLGKGVDWDTLALAQVLGPWRDEAFLTFEGAAVTPLQHAFLKNCPLTAQHLLQSGADPRATVVSSCLPQWTLENGLGAEELANRHLDEPGSKAAIEAWGCTSEAVLATVPQLFFNMATFTEELSWEHVRAHVAILVRANTLDSSLPPAASGSKNGPRF